MRAILACDNAFGIGKNGGLLTYLPDDLRYFKEQTLNKTVIMGRKTLESFPNKKPLPNRGNIVLTRNKEYKAPQKDVLVFYNKKEVLDFVKNKNKDDVFIIGGAEIYRLFLYDCDEILLTKIDYTFDADTFFINIDKNPNFKLMSCSEIKENNGYKFKFCKYKKI